MNEVKKHISAAYNWLRRMEVSGENVKRVALAEQELETAFRAVEELEESNRKEDADGQTD